MNNNSDFGVVNTKLDYFFNSGIISTIYYMRENYMSVFEHSLFLNNNSASTSSCANAECKMTQCHVESRKFWNSRESWMPLLFLFRTRYTNYLKCRTPYWASYPCTAACVAPVEIISAAIKTPWYKSYSVEYIAVINVKQSLSWKRCDAETVFNGGVKD